MNKFIRLLKPQSAHGLINNLAPFYIKSKHLTF